MVSPVGEFTKEAPRARQEQLKGLVDESASFYLLASQ